MDFTQEPTLEQDAQTITRIIPELTFYEALLLVTSFQNLRSCERMQVVLRNHFKGIGSISKDTLLKETELLQTVFPFLSVERIQAWLKIVHEENRIKVVARILSTLYFPQKRPVEPLLDEEIKKPRISEVNNSRNVPETLSEASGSNNKRGTSFDQSITKILERRLKRNLHNAVETQTATRNNSSVINITADSPNMSEETDSQATVIVTPINTPTSSLDISSSLMPIVKEETADDNDDDEIVEINYDRVSIKPMVIEETRSSNSENLLDNTNMSDIKVEIKEELVDSVHEHARCPNLENLNLKQKPIDVVSKDFIGETVKLKDPDNHAMTYIKKEGFKEELIVLDGLEYPDNHDHDMTYIKEEAKQQPIELESADLIPINYNHDALRNVPSIARPWIASRSTNTAPQSNKSTVISSQSNAALLNEPSTSSKDCNLHNRNKYPDSKKKPSHYELIPIDFNKDAALLNFPTVSSSTGNNDALWNVPSTSRENRTAHTLSDVPQSSRSTVISSQSNAALLNGPSTSSKNYNLQSRSNQPACKSKLLHSETFNIYTHLKDLFHNVSSNHIKHLCKKYSINPYTQPSEKVFDAIVTDIQNEIWSSDDSSDASDDSTDIDFQFLESLKNASRNVPSISSKSSTKSASATAIVHPANTTKRLSCINQVPKGFEQNFNKLLEVIQKSTKDEIMEYTNKETNMELVHRLMEIFPEACPKYIRKICIGKQNVPTVIDELISEILDCDYPKRHRVASPPNVVTADEQLELIKQIIPDADPNYLRIHCERLIDNPDQLKAFVNELVEKRNYPTMKDYLRNQQLSAQQKQYTTDFDVEKYLQLIPDPDKYFNDPKRTPPKLEADAVHYTLCFLRNHYLRVQITKIRDIFRKNNYNFLKTCTEIDKLSSSSFIRVKRAACHMPEAIRNIPLLQEMAYIEHKEELNQYIEAHKIIQQQERNDAKAKGLLQTCNCCYDDEVMLIDLYTCEFGCAFCKCCVKKSIEVAFGEGKLDFRCLSDCTSFFNLQTLQAVLDPKTFSIIALKKQVQEVKAAGIEDLETCPFCDFATIPVQNDKLFRCLNPDCMKESCRACKDPSHVPLRCDEVEKEDEVKTRTYIEDKMTEALIRKCYKCGMKFIKSDGCNKMTCSCGAMMCYVCKQPVKDYKHFNGNGGDQYQLCPLYSNTVELHENSVLQGAKKAKMEIGVNNDPSKLKYDPTSGLTEHYNNEARRIPENPGLVAMPYNVMHLVLNDLRYVDANAREPEPRIMYPRAYNNRNRVHQHHHRRHPDHQF